MALSIFSFFLLNKAQFSVATTATTTRLFDQYGQIVLKVKKIYSTYISNKKNRLNLKKEKYSKGGGGSWGREGGFMGAFSSNYQQSLFIYPKILHYLHNLHYLHVIIIIITVVIIVILRGWGSEVGSHYSCVSH